MKSYFKICAIDADSNYNRWIKFGSCSDYTSSLATYLLADLKDKEVSSLNLPNSKFFVNNNNLTFVFESTRVIYDRKYKIPTLNSELFQTSCLKICTFY